MTSFIGGGDLTISGGINFNEVSNSSNTTNRLYRVNNSLYFNGNSIVVSNGEDITEKDKINYLFKKSFNMPSTDKDARFFQEKYYNAKPNILASQIWNESDQIPNSAPTDLVNLTDSDVGDDNNNIVNNFSGKTSSTNNKVKKYIKIQLESANIINDYSFKAPIDPTHGNVLKNIIPFNHDPYGSYFYRIYKSNGEPINFDYGDWILDADSGVLTFYNLNSTTGIDKNNPPRITFYRYIGSTGLVGGGSGNGGVASALNGYNININSTNSVQINAIQGTTKNILNVTKDGIDIKSEKYINMQTNGVQPITLNTTNGLIKLESNKAVHNAIHINAYNNNGGVLVYGKNNVIIRTGLNGNIISDGVTHVLNNNNLNQGYNLISANQNEYIFNIGSPNTPYNSDSSDLNLTSNMKISEAFSAVDKWINNNLIDMPPVFIAGNTNVTNRYIELNWTLPDRLSFGFSSIKFPFINHIKIDYKKSSDNWNDDNKVTSIIVEKVRHGIGYNVEDVSMVKARFYVSDGTSSIDSNDSTLYNYYKIDSLTSYDFRLYGTNFSSKSIKYTYFNNLQSSAVGIPNAPTLISKAVIDNSSINLKYNAPSIKDVTNNDTVYPSINSYKIIHTASSSVRYGNVINDTGSITSTLTDVNIISLNPGTTYTFDISAQNSGNTNGGTNNDGYGTNLTVNETTEFPEAPKYINNFTLSFKNDYGTTYSNQTTNGYYKLDGTLITNSSSIPLLNRNLVVSNNNKFEFNDLSNVRINNQEGNTGVNISSIYFHLGLGDAYDNFSPQVEFDGYGYNMNYSNTQQYANISSNNSDFYANSDAKNQGFYISGDVSFSSSTLTSTTFIPSYTEYRAELKQVVHPNLTYLSNMLKFYIDTANSVPSVSYLKLNSVNVTFDTHRFISGIPTISNGATISFVTNISGLANHFLRDDKKHFKAYIEDSDNNLITNELIVTKDSIDGVNNFYYDVDTNNPTNTSSTKHNNFGTTLLSTDTSNNIQFNDFTLTLNNISSFDTNINLKLIAYNICGNSSIINGVGLNNPIRIDTKSLETINNLLIISNDYGLRVRSGLDSSTLFFPNTAGSGNNDYGDIYDNNKDISTSSNPRYDSELILYNGKFQTPQNDGYINYTNYYLPSGISNYNYPNYSVITANTDYRFVTFKYNRNLENVSGLTLEFIDSENLTDIKPDNVSFHIKIDGVTNWMNFNKSILPNGVNNYNKDTLDLPCLSTSGYYPSTPTKKYVYIPLATTSGSIYIRIGLRMNSNIKIRYVKLTTGFN